MHTNSPPHLSRKLKLQLENLLLVRRRGPKRCQAAAFPATGCEAIVPLRPEIRVVSPGFRDSECAVKTNFAD
ncbi:TatD Mg-dependent DNase [Pyrenophora tritici-repentis]|nr:TatD Mg-dependent DNase [Pyrenophora tritici-repentis]